MKCWSWVVHCWPHSSESCGAADPFNVTLKIIINNPSSNEFVTFWTASVLNRVLNAAIWMWLALSDSSDAQCSKKNFSLQI